MHSFSGFSSSPCPSLALHFGFCFKFTAFAFCSYFMFIYVFLVFLTIGLPTISSVCFYSPQSLRIRSLWYAFCYKFLLLKNSLKYTPIHTSLTHSYIHYMFVVGFVCCLFHLVVAAVVILRLCWLQQECVLTVRVRLVYIRKCSVRVALICDVRR